LPREQLRVVNPARLASSLAALALAGCVGGARADAVAAPARTSIAGVVRDEQGRPIPAVSIQVEGYPKTLRSPPPWRTDVDGRFQTDDLPEGPATLLVTAGDPWFPSLKKAIRTRAGVRDLVIVLDPGPQLFLRIVGYVPGEQTRWARVVWEDPDGMRNPRHAPIRDDGWIRFVALPADRRFELWVEAEDGARHVRARGLKPGEAEQRIEPHEVKDIAGEVRPSKARLESTAREPWAQLRGRLDVDVYAYAPRGGFMGLRVARTRLRTDGTFRVRGLPPGTYLVSVGTHSGEVIDIGDEYIEAGTTDAVFDLD
jgi:hypothetical protein